MSDARPVGDGPAMARILTVTPNPAIDVTYTAARQALGETVRVTQVRRRPGGKGLNVARVLRTLGRDVVALHPLGGDAGAWIERALVRDGLPATASSIAGETRTTVAVVDGIDHPTLLAEPGPSLSDSEWANLLDTVAAAITPGDWVVVAGSFPPETTPARVTRLVGRVHDGGARLLVDTSGPLLEAAAAAGADVVKANEDEIREATGEDDASRALARLSAHGCDVLISRGRHGALLRLADGSTWNQSAVPGVAGDPTGAGDAATAGFIAALTEGHGPATALAWAAVAGAAAVLRPVAGEIDPAVLAALGGRLGLPSDRLLLPLEPDRSRP